MFFFYYIWYRIKLYIYRVEGLHIKLKWHISLNHLTSACNSDFDWLILSVYMYTSIQRQKQRRQQRQRQTEFLTFIMLIKLNDN